MLLREVPFSRDFASDVVKQFTFPYISFPPACIVAKIDIYCTRLANFPCLIWSSSLDWSYDSCSFLLSCNFSLPPIAACPCGLVAFAVPELQFLCTWLCLLLFAKTCMTWDWSLGCSCGMRSVVVTSRGQFRTSRVRLQPVLYYSYGYLWPWIGGEVVELQLYYWRQ